MNIFESVKNFFGSVIQKVKDAAKAVVEFVSSKKDEIKQTVKNTYNTVSDFVSKHSDDILPLAGIISAVAAIASTVYYVVAFAAQVVPFLFGLGLLLLFLNTFSDLIGDKKITV